MEISVGGIYQIKKASRGGTTKPIELKLTVAEREYQDSKMKLDYMSDFVIAMKKEVEGTMMLHVDGSPAEMDTESIIKDIEKKIKEIR